MPKQVDREQRRAEIAEAVFRVIGTRGLDAVSLRDVAAEAGVSMGSVQHYFSSKAEMLLFALDHMRARVTVRMVAELAELEDPSRRDRMLAGMRAMLPVTEQGRQEAAVNIAYFSIATVNPQYSDLLREGYARLLAFSQASLREASELGELKPGIDPDQEAAAAFFATQGLIGPVLLGVVTAQQALAILDHQLDRIFK